MTTHVVLGMGQVGTAVAQTLRRAHDNNVVCVDLDDTAPPGPRYDLCNMHVCYGWTPDFVETVTAYQNQIHPDIVVVHSTVPVDTCDPHGWVHSPVTGKHPDLAESLLKFTKAFGGHNARYAATEFAHCGVGTQTYDRARDTEASKLVDLTRYAIDIAIERHIADWCTEHDLDLQAVYTDPAIRYNDGYQRMGMGHLAHPVITHTTGPLGGHCLVNAAMMGDPLVRQLLAKHMPTADWDRFA